MMGRVTRISWGDAVLFARIVIIALIVPLLVRLPLGWLASLLELVPVGSVPDSTAPERVPRLLGRAVRYGSPVVRRGCLTRGVTQYCLLRRAGFDVRLVFGMGGPAQGFTGHCWLVLGGEPFLERRDPRPEFAELFRVPRPRPGTTNRNPAAPSILPGTRRG